MAQREFVISISLVKTGAAYRAEWWMSRANSSGTLQMFARLEMPVDASSRSDALSLARDITPELMKVVRLSALIDDAAVNVRPEPQVAAHIFRAHVKEHLRSAGSGFSFASVTSRTKALYRFAQAIGISTPAVVVAEMEGVAPATIHERLRDSSKRGATKSSTKRN